MGKKQLILFLSFLFGGLVMALSFTRIFTNSPQKTQQYLQIVRVIDEAEFSFQPVGYATKHGFQLDLHVTITSYMNPDILDLDLITHIILEVNDGMIQPLVWNETDVSNHHISGRLKFNLSNQPNGFTLKVFTYTDNEITWD